MPNLENSAVATGLEKVSVHSNPKKVNAKECSNYCTTAVLSHTRLQARLQWYVNHELPDVKMDLEKAEEPDIKLPTSIAAAKSLQ